MVGCRGLPVHVLGLNGHLFEEAARYRVGNAWRETGFYYKDTERRERLSEQLRVARREQDPRSACLVGIQEFWDGSNAKLFAQSHRDLFPYSWTDDHPSPGIGGKISDFRSKWPRLGAWLVDPEENIITRLCRNHYSEGEGILAGMRDYLLQDLFAKILRKVFGGPILGSGLMFLSTHPIVSQEFIPHPEQADWQQLARMGVYDARIRLSRDQDLDVSLTHYQEGTTRKAIRVRKKQIQATQERHPNSVVPFLHIADFNIEKNSPEYHAVIRSLGMNEVETERTYLYPNDLQAKLQGGQEGEASAAHHIDYILYRGLMRLLEGKVDPRFDGISDHRLVRAVFEIGKSVVAGAQVLTGEREESEIWLPRAA